MTNYQVTNEQYITSILLKGITFYSSTWNIQTTEIAVDYDELARLEH